LHNQDAIDGRARGAASNPNSFLRDDEELIARSPLPIDLMSLPAVQNQSGEKEGVHRPSTYWRRLRAVPGWPLALAIGLGILALAYWPNLEDLYATWTREPNYSHGFLVIPISLVIFWQRSADEKTRRAARPGPWWSWVALVATLAARVFAYERNSQWLESVTIVPAVALLILTLGGWPLLRRAWPAVAFLLFMFPLPPLINSMISSPLQRLATLGSVFVMQLTGLLAIAEGNVIRLPDAPPDTRTLEVALACNGLSMLMTLAATVTATIALVPLSNWKRFVVLASAVPIALLSNMIRIVATGWFYYVITGEGAKKLAHDWSGWLMMPLALILVGLEVLILSWLTSGSESKDQGVPRPVLAIFPQSGSGKTKLSTDDI
jgi:exosortase